MNPTYSLLHATLGRPEKAVAAMLAWCQSASYGSSIEYIFACNNDDEASTEKMMPLLYDLRHERTKWRIVRGDFRGSASAWDAAAKESTGDLLVQVSDDYFPPETWSGTLLDRITARAGIDWDTKALVVRVGEHYRKDDLMTMAICSRKYYKLQGEFLHAGYQSVFSDDEFTIRSVAAARDGACIIIDARDVVFRHENPYHTGAPHDETLKRQNSEAAYAEGVKLFVERNWRLINAGLKTW